MAEIKKISTELQLLDKLLDTSGDAGTSGQVLSSTGTGTNWIDAASGTVTTSSSGSSGFIPKFTSSSALANSILEVNSALPSSVIIPEYIRHRGDTNTYFGFHSNDTILLATNNNEVMRVTSAGNVGIGTTTPTAPLDVAGVRAGRDWALSGRANIRLDSDGTGNPSDILFGHTSAANQTSWTGVYWALSSRGTADGNKFHFYRGGGNPGGNEAVAMTIASDLKIGIGTTSPNEELHIVAAAADLRLQSTGADQAARYILQTDDQQWRIGTHGGQSDNLWFYDATNPAYRMVISTAGNVGIGTNSPAKRLHISSGDQSTSRIRISNTNTSSGGDNIDLIAGINNVGQDGFSIFNATSNQTQFVIQGGGNVGIGTSSPNQKLQVGGNLHVYDEEGDTNAAIFISTGTSDTTTVAIRSSGTSFLNGGNVGIGTTAPSNKLHVSGGSSHDIIARFEATGTGTGDYSEIHIANNNNNRLILGSIGSNYSNSAWAGMRYVYSTVGDLGLKAVAADGNVRIYAGGSGLERMRINSTGDVGIGTIQHTAGNTWRGFFVGSSASIISRQAAAGTDAMFSNNFYINSSNVDKRITTGGASRIFINQDVMRFQRSASDDADTTISWSESMRIDNSGNVGIGTTSPAAKLHIDITSEDNQPGFKVEKVSDSGENAMEIHHGTSSSLRGIADFTNNNGSVMFLRGDGNVGVGSTAPEKRLDVRGDIQIHSGSSATSVQELGFKNIYNTAFLRASYTNPSQITETYLAFHTNTSGANNGTVAEQMRIAGNKVGIGTSTPSEKLEISGTGELSAKFNNTQYSRSFTITQGGGFSHLKTSHSSGVAINYGQGNVGILSLFNNTTQAIKINANGDSYFNGGDVGIGTTSPLAKLHVEGNLELKAGWEIGSNDGSYWQRIRTVDSSSTTAQAFNFETRNGSGSFITHATILNNGNVGVGIAPVAKLHVYQNNSDDDTTAGVTIEQDGTGDAALSFLLTGTRRWRLGIDNNDSDKFKISDSTNLAASNKLTIDVDGNVGVGTTSPGNKLHVNGGEIQVVNGTSGKLLLQNSTNYVYGDQNGVAIFNANNNLRLYTVGSERLRINSSGNIGIGTTSPATKLHVAAASSNSQLTLERTGSATGKYLIYTNTNNLYFNNVASSTFPLTILNSGNVGIGTTSPTEKLEVAGDIKLSGNGTSNDSYAINFTNGACAIARDANDLELHAYDNMVFGVSNTSYPTSTERMRITSSGSVGINRTSPGNFTGLTFTGKILDVDGLIQSRQGILQLGGSSYRKAALFTSTGTDAPYLDFRVASSGTSSNTTVRMNINSSGGIKFNAYGSGTFTGTAAYALAVDNAGNIIETAAGGGGSFLPLAGGTMGSNAIITGTDSLIIKADSQILFRGDAGSNIASIKTVNTDYDIIELLDNNRMRWRDGMEIYLDDSSATNYMMFTTETSGAGNHALHRFAGYEFQGTGLGNNTIMKLVGTVNAGYVELYHSNVKKFETTSAGVTITGSLTASDSLIATNSVIIGANSTPEQVAIFEGSTNEMWFQQGTAGGTVKWQTDNFVIQGFNGNETQFTSTRNGAVELYYDNAKTFSTASGGVTVHGTSATLNLLSGTNANGIINFGDPADNNPGQIIYRHNGNSMSFDTADNERMRIDMNGNVGINTTSPGVKFEVIHSDTGNGYSDGVARFHNNTTSSMGGAAVLNVRNSYNAGFGGLIKFWTASIMSSVGNISFNSGRTAVNYNTSSDYRLKEDYKDFDALDLTSKIKVYDFKWKNVNDRSYGVIAHELDEIVPSVVSGDKDGEEMQSVDYSKLVPVLIKSIQELEARLAALEN